ncbi:hypothetical protein CRG98_021675 [Punica granatum]|uniref:Uncharacterized protein n=1 Tax=Punica granatum TaxID=22663 RepID=A0A2I0JR17_PUNGR|nr:hypothetical protein CRG98_021675 [Punica granatum]
MVFGLSRVGRRSEYRAVFRWFWPVFGHEVGCAGMRREGLGVGAIGQEGWSRGLGGQAEVMGSSRGYGFEPWLGGLAWLSRESHLTRRKAEGSSRRD